jgi:hypothetical protein
MLVMPNGKHAGRDYRAALRLMSVTHEDSRAFLVGAGKELAALLGQDYARLKATLERIKP